MFKKLGFAIFMLIITASSLVFAGGGKGGSQKKEVVIVAPCTERTTRADCGAGPHCVWDSTRNSCMKGDCFGRSRTECSIILGEVCDWSESVGACQKVPCRGRSPQSCAVGKCELDGSSCRDKRSGR